MIGYLGPEGTYTDEAAKQLFPATTRTAYPSIDAVFDAVASRAISTGVVPIESLLQGPVTETLDNLFRYAGQVTISDMLVLPIDHAIGALGAAADIRRILSKDQALHQCSEYIARQFPGAALIDTPSTAAAMEMIVRQGWHDAAAIGNAAALTALTFYLIRHSVLTLIVLGAVIVVSFLTEWCFQKFLKREIQKRV